MSPPPAVSRRSRWGAAVAVALLFAVTAGASHPFYERRLTEGILAFEQGRLEEAARSFEIAAFGLLDEPPRLAEALVRLALTQARLERAPAFRETVRRVAEVEERFGGYRAAALSDAERVDFSGRIRELVPASVLARAPAIQQLLDGEEGVQTTQTAQTAAAAEETPEPPRRKRKKPRQEGAQEPAAPEPEAPEPEATEPAAAGPETLPAAEQGRMERARAILAQARQAPELDEARAIAQPLADAHPDRPDLQQLMGEIAYRSSRWVEAAEYLQRGLRIELEPAVDAVIPRPELLFYLAVSLYESGRPQEARKPLERALPRIERTAFVDRYVDKILAGSGTTRLPDPEGAS